MNFLIGLVILASTSSFASSLNGKWEIDTFTCTNGKSMGRETRKMLKESLSDFTYVVSIKGKEFTRKFAHECGTTIEKFTLTHQTVSNPETMLFGKKAPFKSLLRDSIKRNCQQQSQLLPESNYLVVTKNVTGGRLMITDPALDMLAFYCPENSEALIVLKKK